LPPIAECQPLHLCLKHRNRGQAPSHILICVPAAVSLHLAHRVEQMQGSLLVSHTSVERIQQARDSFDKIRGSVDSIRDQNTQIATAAQEQYQVAEEAWWAASNSKASANKTVGGGLPPIAIGIYTPSRGPKPVTAQQPKPL